VENRGFAIRSVGLRLYREADFLEPGEWNRTGDVFVGELPAMQAVFARMPREIRSAVVDDRRKADAAQLRVQEDQAKIAAFRAAAAAIAGATS